MGKPSQFVKTTISVPSDVYVRATRRAKQLGTSRSAFFTEAVARELADASSNDDIVDQINSVVEEVNSDSSEFVETAARRTLLKDDATKW